eukprot:gene17857-24241_t
MSPKPKPPPPRIAGKAGKGETYYKNMMKNREPYEGTFLKGPNTLDMAVLEEFLDQKLLEEFVPPASAAVTRRPREKQAGGVMSETVAAKAKGRGMVIPAPLLPTGKL